MRTAGDALVFRLLLVILLSGPSLSAAQQAPERPGTTTVEKSGQAPAQKTTPTGNASPRGIKGAAERFGSIVSPDREARTGPLFTAGIIVSGSGLSGGAGYRWIDEIPSSGIDVEVSGALSVRRYQDYRVAIGVLNARSSTLEFDTADSKVSSLFNDSARKAPGSAVFIEMRYRNYPSHTHYGPGIDSREGDRSDYGLHGGSLEGVWQRQLSPRLGVSMRGGFLDLAVSSGRNDSLVNLENRFDPASVPGALRQPAFVTLGGAIVHDTRERPGAPEDGRLIGFSMRRFSALAASELSFTRLTVEARAYTRALSRRGVIAARAIVSTDLGGDESATPFYLQTSLGGGDLLRGFHSYRFADAALAHATVEYRWRAHRFIEVVPFIDVGTVAPGLSRLSIGALEATPGIGIRGRTDGRAIGRLDWAWSREGYRIVFGVGPAF